MTRPDRTCLAPKKILVVDDHPLIVKYMLNFLQGQGHEVATARDALAALNVLQNFRPDIIIIDLVMPEISGDQLCRIIRSKQEHRHTFIIILSAIAAEQQTDYLAFGADACIAKGSFHRMEEHILKVLQTAELEDGLTRQQIVGMDDVYERQITRELLSSRNRFERILAHITEGILQITCKGVIIFVNPVARTLFDCKEEGLLAADFQGMFASAQRQQIAVLLKKIGKTDKARTLSAVPYRKKHFDMTFVPIDDEGVCSVLIVIRDVTRALHMESALRESEVQYQLLFSEMVSGFVFCEIVKDSGGRPRDYLIRKMNAAFEQMSGQEAAVMLGRGLSEIYPEDHRFFFEKFALLSNGTHARFEYHCARNDRYFEITAYCPKSGQLAVLMNEITDRKQLEKRLHDTSVTDDLTGLLNRRGFISMAEKQLQIARREGNPLHLIFADFDNLKKINDSMGHMMGDQALLDAADLLRHTFRESDIIGRFGGDEFAVLLVGNPGEAPRQSVRDRLAKNMARQNEMNRQYELSLSCGLASFDPETPCSLDELISLADGEMYQEKGTKKNSC